MIWQGFIPCFFFLCITNFLETKTPYPYINFFETYRSIDAKRFIAVLMTIYPELYVDVDEADFWYGTAQEYLDTEFDY